MDTIWVITRDFEYEGGNGRTYWEPVVDVDLGYFISEEGAQLKLALLQDAEREDYERRFNRGALQAWQSRVGEDARIVAQNVALEAAGLPLLQRRWVGEEPEMKPWTPKMSAYGIVEIKPGELS